MFVQINVLFVTEGNAQKVVGKIAATGSKMFMNNKHKEKRSDKLSERFSRFATIQNTIKEEHSNFML